MRRLLIALLLVIASLDALAQKTRSVAPEAIKLPEVSGSTVSGTVTGVSGSIIQLANGLVQIDASQAKISDGSDTTLAVIVPGTFIMAVLKPGEAGANGVLPASIITVTRLAQVVLTGPVTSVDAANNRFVVLGRTINVNGNTRSGTKLSSLQTGSIVVVEANNVNGSLVATSMQVVASHPQPTIVIHGNVKSIGSGSWVINDSSGKETTVIVTSSTKIAGSPAVGDIVDVVATIDDAHQYTALSISRSVDVKPPTTISVSFRGVVKSISATSWSILDDKAPANGEPTVVQITTATKFVGDPKVGDHVEVLLQPGSSTRVALLIVKTP